MKLELNLRDSTALMLRNPNITEDIRLTDTFNRPFVNENLAVLRHAILNAKITEGFFEVGDVVYDEIDRRGYFRHLGLVTWVGYDSFNLLLKDGTTEMHKFFDDDGCDRFLWHKTGQTLPVVDLLNSINNRPLNENSNEQDGFANIKTPSSTV